MTTCKHQNFKPLKLIEQPGQPKKVESPDYLTPYMITIAYTYLQDRGWFNKIPVNDQGYTPWFTYPAIEALDDLVHPDMKIFEYGSGFGTLSLHNKVKEYASVEHNKEWIEELKKVEPNIRSVGIGPNEPIIPWALEHVQEFEALNWDESRTDDLVHDTMHGFANKEFAGYASEIATKKKGYYDLIIVDGMARLLSGYLASKYISKTGVIILDNSDRWQYNPLQKYLIEEGFGRIDFWGPGTGRQDFWCTSFFSKGFKVKNKNPERPIGDKVVFT